MSWHEIALTHSCLPRIYEGVEVSARSEKERAILRIRLGDDVLSEMGWQMGTKLRLIRGTHADAGMLALVLTTNGGVKVRKSTSKSRALVVESVKAAKVIGCHQDHEPVLCKYHKGQVKLEDGTLLEPALVIVLPAWARNGEKGGAK